MCEWGKTKRISVLRRPPLSPFSDDGRYPVEVDFCIADYVQTMNDRGIVTVSCCCGHGKTPPSVLVDMASIFDLARFGYKYTQYDNRDDVIFVHVSDR